MPQLLSFFPVYDASQGRRSSKLKFWVPLKHLFPDLISSRQVVHRKVGISAYYALKMVRHDLRKQLSMNDQVTLFMDSGGYQLMTKHFSAKPNDIMNILRYQERNGADIAATLDFPFRPEQTSLWEGWRRIQITIKYAITALQNREKFSMKLYAVIHGWDPLSTKKVAELLDKYDFDGYALGAPEPENYGMSMPNYLLKLTQMIYGVKEIIGEKPLHVFGISNFAAIYLFAALGVSSFDSLKYLHAAKFRNYILPNGWIAHIGRSAKSRKLSELPCSCPICSEVDLAFMAANGSVQGALLALHNLTVIRNHVRLINSALVNGWYTELMKLGMKNFPNIVSSIEWLLKQSQNFLR